MAGQTSNYQIYVIIILSITFYLFEDPYPIPFSSGWCISLNWLTCPCVSYFYGSPICMKLNSFYPVNLSYVNLIIRPVKESRREEGKAFLPNTCKDWVYTRAYRMLFSSLTQFLSELNCPLYFQIPWFKFHNKWKSKDITKQS